MKKLSEYTKASNCTDLTDLHDGALEISEAIEYRINRNLSVPYYYYIRFGKIMKKIDKFEGHGIVNNAGRTLVWYSEQVEKLVL
jgi:hypothetical protein